MVTQLLFGELFEIIYKNEGWFHIKLPTDLDVWVHQTQMYELSQKQHERISKKSIALAFDAFNTGISEQEHIPIVIGSELHGFDGLSFKMGKEKIIYNGQVRMLNDKRLNPQIIEKICLKYLNAPFLWGGRSPFGIDAPGLVNIVYKLLGIFIPYTIAQQEQSGRTLAFLPEAEVGDLLFFTDEENHPHVGILIEQNKVIHAFGKVRIDQVDSHGLFDAKTNLYTHKLTSIKKISI